jgi:peptidoglycan biosynthesis protein MviN/MurJ (putative lipid II flippase)
MVFENTNRCRFWIFLVLIFSVSILVFFCFGIRSSAFYARADLRPPAITMSMCATMGPVVNTVHRGVNPVYGFPF